MEGIKKFLREEKYEEILISKKSKKRFNRIKIRGENFYEEGDEVFGREHYRRIKNSGKGVCCICDKKIKESQHSIYIGKAKGEKLFRHDRCNCLSEAWVKKFKGCEEIINH